MIRWHHRWLLCCRARRRLKERQQAAAVQIQRVVRGRLARREVSTLRFNKVTRSPRTVLSTTNSLHC